MTTAIHPKDVCECDWDEKLHAEVATFRPSFSTANRTLESLIPNEPLCCTDLAYVRKLSLNGGPGWFFDGLISSSGD
jgi:hypothetical protein